MDKVFICSPYSKGNIEENLNNAKKYSKLAVNAGYIPITPHIYFTQFLDDKKIAERTLGMLLGKILLKECSELWYFGEPTEGMLEEIQLAKTLNINIVKKEIN